MEPVVSPTLVSIYIEFSLVTKYKSAFCQVLAQSSFVTDEQTGRIHCSERHVVDM
jgi:hypothetical protein